VVESFVVIFIANQELMKKLSLLFTLLLINSLSAQVQLGGDIDGDASYDYLGTSVSISSDGTTVAIGANGNDGNGSNAGHVRIYEYSAGSWTQLGADIDGEANWDQSGYSVSLSSDGTRVAIGAIDNDGTSTNTGHVRIFEYSAGSWTQLGSDIDGEAAGDLSGWSVSLSSNGTTVAIGAPGNNGNGTNSGHVRIYEYSAGSWTQLGADIDGEAANDQSGTSVSLSSDGTTVAIGAFGNDGNGSNAGHVRIYEYSASSWTQLGADIDGEAAFDDSGYSVSLSSDGTTVAIGARFNDGNGTAAGHVRIYEYSAGSWTQLGADIDGEAANDQSGWSVSLSSDGTTLAIGAIGQDGNGADTGHVRIYEYSAGSWTQLGADIDGEAAGDGSGTSVSLSSDGTIVAIGAPGNGNYSGHVRVYNVFPVDAGANDTICAGNAVTLTATGGSLNTTYVWSGGISNGVAFIPTTSANYIVTAYDQQNNILGTDTVHISVQSVAAPSTPTTNYGYCLGYTSVPLTAIPATGNALLWYDTDGVTVLSSAPTPQTSISGTSTYFVSQINSQGCESPKASITVEVFAKPSPPTITNQNIEYCIGDVAVPLNATASAGNSLQWYDSSNNLLSTFTGPVPSTSTAGSFTYYVRQVTFLGCSSDPTTITVTVNALPSISVVGGSSQTVCDGSAITLSAVGGGVNATYQWSGGVSNGVAFVPPASTTSTYTVTGTDANGCQNTASANVISAICNSGVTANHSIPLQACTGNISTYSFDITSDFDSTNYFRVEISDPGSNSTNPTFNGNYIEVNEFYAYEVDTNYQIAVKIPKTLTQGVYSVRLVSSSPVSTTGIIGNIIIGKSWDLILTSDVNVLLDTVSNNDTLLVCNSEALKVFVEPENGGLQNTWTWDWYKNGNQVFQSPYSDSLSLTGSNQEGAYWVKGDYNLCSSYSDTFYFKEESYSGFLTSSGLYYNPPNPITAIATGGTSYQWSADKPIFIDDVTNDTVEVALMSDSTILAVDVSYGLNCIHTHSILLMDTSTIVCDVYDTTLVIINDTNHINIYDTSYVNVYDTTYIAVYDTNVVDVFDTTYVTVYDTNYIDVFDTTYIDVFDTSYVDIFDTTYINVYDTVLVTQIDTIYLTVTDTLIIDVSLIGINPPTFEYQLRVYPNPTNSYLHVEVPQNMIGQSYSMEIKNSIGQSMFGVGLNQPLVQIDFNSFGAAGSYTLLLKNPQGAVIDTRIIVLQ
jgi:hypothetical protein